MVRDLLSPFGLLIAGSALCQWTNDPLLNTTVRDGTGVVAATPLQSEGPDGSTYISWFDQAGGYQLRMQRLDAQGYPLWDPAGLLVSDQPQNTALFRYDLATDHEGNAIVAFQDMRSGDMRPVAYKLAPDGSFLWGMDGLLLSDASGGTGLAPAIGILANNDVILAWNGDNGGNGYIPFVSISATGAFLWPEAEVISGTGNWSRPKVIATSDGGFFIQCIQETGNFPFTNTLFAKRFNAQGTELFQTPISTRTTSVFFFPEPIPDGQDGFYVNFDTGNPANASLTDVTVQRVRANGTLWSTTGSVMMTGATTQRYSGGLALVSDDDGLMVPLRVTNTAQSQGGLYVQRVDTAGNILLSNSAVVLMPITATLPTPVDAAATVDGAIIVHVQGGFGDERLVATRVDLSGAAVWTPEQVILSSVNSSKGDAACGAFVNDRLVVVWEDDRLGSGIYAQALSGSGDLGVVTGTATAFGKEPMQLLLIQEVDRPWLVVHDAPSGPAHLRLIDVSGRLLNDRAVMLNGGTQWIALLDRPIEGALILELATVNDIARVKWVAR